MNIPQELQTMRAAQVKRLAQIPGFRVRIIKPRIPKPELSPRKLNQVIAKLTEAREHWSDGEFIDSEYGDIEYGDIIEIKRVIT